MSKRFPIPPFDYAQYKNLDWDGPIYLEAQEQARLIDAAQSGALEATGGYPVRASAAFYERFKLRGQHQHAVMCLLPDRDVKLIGRSHAWAIQQLLVVDSLDAASANIVCEWKTPRPMNTRLGSDTGASLKGGVLFVICSHQYADYWIVNRTLIDNKGFAGATGFGVLSASDDEINDFHACNVWFNW